MVPLAPCFPSRSATASLRGYLYQLLTTALRWLQLGKDEFIVCEGDEDLDRLLCDGTWEGEQVKLLADRVSARSKPVSESVAWFARTFAIRKREGRTCRWTFSTTAPLTWSKYLTAPDLASWHAPASRAAVVRYIRDLAPEAAQGIDELDAWDQFIGAVTWRFEAPSIDVTRGFLRKEISRRWPRLSLEAVEARLVIAVLSKSTEPEIGLRVLSPEDLERLDQEMEGSIAEWARDSRFPALLQHTVSTEVRLAIGVAQAEERHRKLVKLLQACIEPLPARPPPSALLRSEYAVVPFSGREVELTSLDSWLESGEQLCLVHGRAGEGKTRLLIEWCKRVRQGGTPAGFLGERADLESLCNADGLRIAVIDYAEAKMVQVENVLQHLRANPEVRIVLLARSTGEWWEELGRDQYSSRHCVERSLVIPMGLWLPTETSQAEQFSAAGKAFCDVLQREPIDLPPPPAAIADPLLLQIAALLLVFGQRSSTELELLDQLLEHEFRYWRRSIDEVEPSHAVARGAKREARRLAGLVVLAGSMDADQLQAAVQTFVSDPDVARVLVCTIRALYLSEKGTLRPLGPDLLQERLAETAVHSWPHLVLSSVSWVPAETCGPSWAEGLPAWAMVLG